MSEMENHYSSFIAKSLEFCRGEIPLVDVIDTLKSLIEISQGKEVEPVIADLLWYIDTLLGDSYTDKIKECFVNLIKACEKIQSINQSFLKDRLSDDILEALRLINSKQQFSARYVKTKTRVFYKQNKFNLLREANEGFSKLIIELVTFNGQPNLMAERIKSLIGYFDLDPNRVIDLILDVLEMRLDKAEIFILLLSLLNADRQDMTDLIGHKFTGNVSDSAYELIVTLIRHDAIDLSGIWEHLSPTDALIRESYEKEMEQARVKKIVTMNSAPKLRDDNVVGTENEKIDEVKVEEKLYSDYQKLHLCYHFIKDGDWQNTRTIMNWLPPYFACRYKPIISLLTYNLDAMIEPIYSRYFPLPSFLKSRRPIIKLSNLKGVFADIVNDFDSMNNLLFEITNYIGPLLSSNLILLTKLIRLSQCYFNEIKGSSSNSFVDQTCQGFYNLYRNCLFPCLSMLNGNVSLAEEIWEAIKYLPYDIRYSLYAWWKDQTDDSHPDLVEQKRSVHSQVKYILKRLSKENVKQFGRQLGKLCHCNPGIVFAEVLYNIIMYSNLTAPVTETFKYLGSLSMDILVHSIIETLASNRVKFDDFQQQQNQPISVLATFCGLLCKRYQLDLVGLLQFVLNKIKDGQCADLLIVKEVIHKMTGIEISEDMTDEQMDAMAGGDLLRQEAGYFIQIRNVRKNSARLKEVLLDHNLAIPYVIMLSQERNIIVRKFAEYHLKVIGRHYDQCQDTMLQMISFFSLHWSQNEMINNCPSISDLFNDFKVAPDVAFYLNRTNFNYRVQEKFKQKKIEQQQTDISDNQELELFSNACQDSIEEYVAAVSPYFLQEIWDDFNSSFYTTFWLLQTSDLIVPDAAYKRQETYLRTQIRQTETDTSMNSVKRQKEIDRFNNLIERLKEEQKRSEQHVKMVDHWLNSVKSKWFVKTRAGSAKAIVMTRFIELCVFPRVCFSSNDALFVAHMICKLHRMKTPSFSTLICLDRIFNDITLMITTCSENEAKRYGRFLDSMLTLTMRWHSSEDIFTEECIAHPGFVTVFRKNTDGNNKADQLTYENYRHVLHKWHYRITKSIVSCLESENYVQIRNSLIVLEKISNNYPKVQQFGQAIERRIENLKEKEKDKRPDLHILTQSYYGHLVSKKAMWLQDKDFHQKEENVSKKPVPTTNVTTKSSANEKSSVNGSVERDRSSSVKKETATKRLSDSEDKELIETKRRKVETGQNARKSSSPKSRSQSEVRTTAKTSSNSIRQSSGGMNSKSRSVVEKPRKSPIMSPLKAQAYKRNVLSRSKDN